MFALSFPADPLLFKTLLLAEGLGPKNPIEDSSVSTVCSIPRVYQKISFPPKPIPSAHSSYNDFCCLPHFLASSQSRDYMRLQKLYGTLKHDNTNPLNVPMVYLL